MSLPIDLNVDGAMFKKMLSQRFVIRVCTESVGLRRLGLFNNAKID